MRACGGVEYRPSTWLRENMCRKLKECEDNDAGHETRMLRGTCSLPLTGAIGGDSLMKISKYLETHGVGMPSRLVHILLIRIEKGIDSGDDMPSLLENGAVGCTRVSIGCAGC